MCPDPVRGAPATCTRGPECSVSAAPFMVQHAMRTPWCFRTSFHRGHCRRGVSNLMYIHILVSARFLTTSRLGSPAAVANSDDQPISSSCHRATVDIVDCPSQRCLDSCLAGLSGSCSVSDESGEQGRRFRCVRRRGTVRRRRVGYHAHFRPGQEREAVIHESMTLQDDAKVCDVHFLLPDGNTRKWPNCAAGAHGRIAPDGIVYLCPRKVSCNDHDPPRTSHCRAADGPPNFSR